MSVASPMKYFCMFENWVCCSWTHDPSAVLVYKYPADILAKRAPFRADHLKLAQKYVDDGMLLLGGALDPPSDGILAFRAPSKAEVEAFVSQDPYVINHVVDGYEIKDWNVVVKNANL